MAPFKNTLDDLTPQSHTASFDLLVHQKSIAISHAFKIAEATDLTK